MKKILILFIIFLAPVHKTNSNPIGLRYNLIASLPDLYIDPASEKIGHTWSHGNIWEKNLIQKFYSLLPKDRHFVALDLGAQTGCFSLLAKFFPNSTWHSFEPIQEAANTLKKNIEINDIPNIFVHPVAVSNFSGKATLKMPAMNVWGLATIGSNVLRFDTITEEREVNCIDLDSFIETYDILKVDFMKIDTEGSELYILLGAKKMIMRDHPIILMEYNETNMKQCGATKEAINNFLIDMGYQWELVSSEDILCTPLIK